MHRSIAATALLAVLLATGCSPSSPDGGDDASEPAATATAESPEPTGDPSVVGPPLSERTAAPTDAPEGDSFSFDEAARFDDGLQVEVVDVKTGRAGADDEGADGTDGQIITAEILISNETTSPFNARTVTVQAFYGDGVGAPMVLDEKGDYVAGFDDDVAAGQDIQGTFAFAVPKDQAKRITLEVNCNDDHLHPPVQFSGSAS